MILGSSGPLRRRERPSGQIPTVAKANRLSSHWIINTKAHVRVQDRALWTRWVRIILTLVSSLREVPHIWRPELTVCLVEKLENPFASGAFKDPSKKFAVELQVPTRGEERTSAFRMPQNVPLDVLNSSQEDQAHEFKMPLNVPVDMRSSSQEDQGPEFKVPKALPLSPPRNFKMPVGLPIENGGAQNIRNVAKAVLSGKGRPGDLCKTPNDSDTTLSNDPSPKPPALTEVSNSSSSSPLSSPPDSPTLVSSQEAQGGFTGKRDIFLGNHTARCPMCREAVDADFLSGFSDGRVMNVRKQTKFCRAHKQKSAKVEWGVRGYPDINWDGLQSRIEKYYSELEDILEGRTSSYFKESLEVNFKSGKNRTLAQSIMSPNFQALTPGYYGSRGARIM
jgi:RTC4-like domain